MLLSSSAIVRNDGMVMNDYSGLGHYIEMVPAVIHTTGVFGDKGVSIICHLQLLPESYRANTYTDFSWGITKTSTARKSMIQV
jgi:hypothetical protein